MRGSFYDQGVEASYSTQLILKACLRLPTHTQQVNLQWVALWGGVRIELGTSASWNSFLAITPTPWVQKHARLNLKIAQTQTNMSQYNLIWSWALILAVSLGLNSSFVKLMLTDSDLNMDYTTCQPNQPNF